MSIKTIKLPNSVIRGQHALEQLGKISGQLGRRAILIGGNRALSVVKDRVYQQLKMHGVNLVSCEWFGGECSMSHIDRIVQEIHDYDITLLIAAGGGKALDTGKIVADKCHIPVITLPTIATTAACTTPLAMLYHDDGCFQENYITSRAPAAIFIDSDIIAHSPMEGLSAGLGAALAKWYEFTALNNISKTEIDGYTSLRHAYSYVSYDIITRYAGNAHTSLRVKQTNHAFEQVLDTIFIFTGMAVTFADTHSTTLSQSLYEGFTLCDKTRHIAYGHLVGYSSLCLLALDNRHEQALAEAIKLTHSYAMPTSMQQIAPTLTMEELDHIINAAISTLNHQDGTSTPTKKQLFNAIWHVDSLARKLLNNEK